MSKTAARLGQHFLHSPSAIKSMGDAAHIDEDSTVLEIGPGEGVLTQELLSRAKKVIAVEKDSALVEKLRETFKEEIANEKLILIEGDFRDHSPNELSIEEGFVVAANIPYYITGEIIRTLLSAKNQPKHIALLIQKEVALRIVARDGKGSILSNSVKAYGIPKVVKVVPRGAFRPIPAVDSAILAIENVSREFFDDFSEDDFFRILKAGFAGKRKQLHGNLRAVSTPEEIIKACEVCDIAPTTRAETLKLEEWACLTKELLKKGQ